MASFPYMQFQPTNPLDTAIKTAMEVYSVPAQRSQQQAQTSLLQQQAEKERMIVQLLGGATGGMNGGPSEGMGKSGSGVSSGAFGGNTEIQDQLLRQMLGLPSEFPGERTRRERETHQANSIFNKDVEKKLGTSGSITQKQNMSLGADLTIPLLDQLIDLEVPGQVIGKTFSPNVQAEYQGLVSNIVDKVLKGMDLTSSEENTRSVRKMVERQPFEKEESYKNRLRDLKEEMFFIKDVTSSGQPNHGGQSNNHGQQSKNSGKVRIQAPDGTIRMVPSALVDAALKAGGKRA